MHMYDLIVAALFILPTIMLAIMAFQYGPTVYRWARGR